MLQIRNTKKNESQRRKGSLLQAHKTIIASEQNFVPVVSCFQKANCPPSVA
jgi:plasmid rolling circle replication initiator protein Rep